MNLHLIHPHPAQLMEMLRKHIKYLWNLHYFFVYFLFVLCKLFLFNLYCLHGQYLIYNFQFSAMQGMKKGKRTGCRTMWERCECSLFVLCRCSGPSVPTSPRSKPILSQWSHSQLVTQLCSPTDCHWLNNESHQRRKWCWQKSINILTKLLNFGISFRCDIAFG